jgi:adenine phosphoribosyltransferase
MYINDLHKGEKVLLVDDVISTGGTLKGTIQAIRRSGASLRDVVVVLEKGNHKAEVEAETAIFIKTLVKLEVANGRVVVLG